MKMTMNKRKSTCFLIIYIKYLFFIFLVKKDVETKKKRFEGYLLMIILKLEYLLRYFSSFYHYIS